MATIKIPAVKSTKVIVQEVNEVLFADGIKINVTGPNNSTTRKPLYLKALESSQITPPIIIIPPVGPREIGNKELSQLSDINGESFILKPGIYTSRCDLNNVNNVSIDGLGKVQFQTKQRAIQFNGNPPSGVTLKGLSFKDIEDYCIDFWDHGKNPIGKDTNGFNFIDIVAENSGTVLHIDGDLNHGMIKDLIVSNLTFINSPEPRTAVYVGNGKNYNINNSKVNNINYSSSADLPNGAHNGIFQLGGWGKFYNNRITNHQGNALRSWLFSQDEVGLVEIYNNLVFNSLKYSAFEVQNKLQSTKDCNVKIYNNTVGRMNTRKDWEGQILDLYSFNGTLDFYNNLGFELNRVGKQTTDMINGNGEASKGSKLTNNKYFETYQQAVKDLVNFESLYPGVGYKPF